VVNNFNCRGFGPLLEDKLCLIFKLAPSVCRMTFPILASLLVRLVVLLPFQLLRLSLATPSRWTPLALSVFLHCVVALLLTLVSVSCAYTQGKREQFSGFNRTLDAINNVFRKFSAFHDETGRLNVDGMNIISNDGSNKLNRSRKARVSYKVQRTINASLNAATSTRAVSSNPNFVTRQKIEIIFG